MSYISEVLADNPVLFLRLDEPSGNFADISPNAFVGTPHGTVTRQVATGFAGLPVGVSLGGAGTDFITVPDANALDQTGDVTFEMWVNPTSLGAASQILMQKGNSAVSAGGYSLFVNTSSQLVVNNSFTGTTYATSTGTISAGVEQHIAFTRVANQYVFYINGVAAGSPSNAGAIQATTNSFFVGAGSGGGNPYGGGVASVAVYGAGLSGARIAAHYAARNDATATQPQIMLPRSVSDAFRR